MRVVRCCLEFIDKSNDRNEKVLHFQQPEELLKKFDFEIGETPRNLESIIEDCARALANQVKTGKDHFVL